MRTLKLLGEILLWALAILAIFSLGIRLFWHQLPIRFVSWQVQNKYFDFLSLAGPVAGFTAKMLHYALRKSKGSIWVHLMAAGFLLVGPFTLYMILNFVFMFGGGWVDDQLLYEHNTENKKVVMQLIPSTHEKRIVLIRPLSNDLEWAIKVDTLSLSTDEWRVIPKEKRQISW